MTERSCIYYDPYNKPCCTECGSDLQLCQCENPDEAAHQRITSPEGVIISMIMGQLDADRAEGADTTHLLATLSKSTGELAQAMIEHDRAQGTTVQEVMREAVRVATMAIRIATEGDENFLYEFPVVEEDLPRGPVGGRYD